MLEPARKAIGNASMKEDGTIVVDLRDPWAREEIAPDHPDHAKWLAHLGGLAPGEQKLVPRWPDGIDDAAVEAKLQEHVRGLGMSPDECKATILGTDAQGNVLISVGCGKQRLRLRLRAGTYEVTDLTDPK